nr:uncharacterized protein LOC109166032 [Ipomoea batatas]
MHTWKWKGKSHLQPEQNPKAYQRNDGIHTCYNRATDGIGAVEKCTGKDCSFIGQYPSRNWIIRSEIGNKAFQTEGGDDLAGTSRGNSNSVPAPVIQPAIYDPKDRTDPLHLHPNESPSLQLVTVQLEGRMNYHPWARAMEMALRSKNKMALVNGSMSILSEIDPRYFYWDQCNTMVLSWILRAVSPTIARGVLWINTAEGVWKDLKKRFSQQDVFRIAEIHSEIHQTKQGFANGEKGYKLFDVHTREVLISRDVSFYEDTFPFQISQNQQPANLVLPAETMSYSEHDEHPFTPILEHDPYEIQPSEQTNEPAVDLELAVDNEPTVEDTRLINYLAHDYKTVHLLNAIEFFANARLKRDEINSRVNGMNVVIIQSERVSNLTIQATPTIKTPCGRK